MLSLDLKFSYGENRHFRAVRGIKKGPKKRLLVYGRPYTSFILSSSDDNIIHG